VRYWNVHRCRLVMETRPFVKGLECCPLNWIKPGDLHFKWRPFCASYTKLLWNWRVHTVSLTGVVVWHLSSAQNKRRILNYTAHQRTQDMNMSRSHVTATKWHFAMQLLLPICGRTYECQCKKITSFEFCRSSKLSRSRRSDPIKRRKRQAYWSSGSYATLRMHHRILRTPFRLAA